MAATKPTKSFPNGGKGSPKDRNGGLSNETAGAIKGTRVTKGGK